MSRRYTNSKEAPISLERLEKAFKALSKDRENITSRRINFVDNLIRRGGKDLVTARSLDGTALHLAMIYQCPLKIVDTLLEIGGKDLLFHKGGEDGGTALHEVCRHASDRTEELMKRLIRAGGKELLFTRDTYWGGTPLHTVCKNIASPELEIKLIKELLLVGGRDLLFAPDDDGKSVLFIRHHSNIEKRSLEVIDFLLDRGGKELFLLQSNEGYTAIQDVLDSNYPNELGCAFDVSDDIWHLMDLYLPRLVKRGIQYQVGGYFGIGGLFASYPQGVQQIEFVNWEELLETLSGPLKELLDHQPCLHAAVMIKAPIEVISFFLENQQHSLLTVDNQGRYPIHVAMEVGLSWEKGMKDIVTAYSSNLNIQDVFKAAKYGLKWNEGMEYILKEVSFYEDQNAEEKDAETGLYLFQVAAMGEKSDLDSIYKFARRDPQLVVQMNLGMQNRVLCLKSPNNEAKRQKLM